MASRAKVQEFFEIAELAQQYSAMMEGIFSQTRANREAEGDSIGVEVADLYKEVFERFQGRILEFAQGLYEEFFTDEEMDELITVHSSPIFKKLRALAPEIQQRLVEFSMNLYGEIEEEIEAVLIPDDFKTDKASQGELPS